MALSSQYYKRVYKNNEVSQIDHRPAVNILAKFGIIIAVISLLGFSIVISEETEARIQLASYFTTAESAGPVTQIESSTAENTGSVAGVSVENDAATFSDLLNDRDFLRSTGIVLTVAGSVTFFYLLFIAFSRK